MKLKFNFNKRNKYKNICSIEGCNNSACGKYCNKHYHQIKRYGHIKTQAYISINNKQINLGYFDTKEKAIAARKFAERKYNINNFLY